MYAASVRFAPFSSPIGINSATLRRRFGIVAGINLLRGDEYSVILPINHDVNQTDDRFQLAELLLRPVEERFGIPRGVDAEIG